MTCGRVYQINRLSDGAKFDFMDVIEVGCEVRITSGVCSLRGRKAQLKIVGIPPRVCVVKVPVLDSEKVRVLYAKLRTDLGQFESGASSDIVLSDWEIPVRPATRCVMVVMVVMGCGVPLRMIVGLVQKAACQVPWCVRGVIHRTRRGYDGLSTNLA